MGRPEIPIDWKKVDELMMAGCLGTEIAAYLGIHPETLYDRCVKETGYSHFSLYLQEKRSKGESLLRAHQYAKALGLTDKGDNTLLIWLGKTRLNQREVDNNQSNSETSKKLDTLVDILAKSQSKSDFINADNNNNNDSKS